MSGNTHAQTHIQKHTTLLYYFIFPRYGVDHNLFTHNTVITSCSDSNGFLTLLNTVHNYTTLQYYSSP
jgi:hypothetical protein